METNQKPKAVSVALTAKDMVGNERVAKDPKL